MCVGRLACPPGDALGARPAICGALGRAVMQALTRAADRNVKVRIYLDGAQLAERDQSKVFRVEIRTKRKPSALMHLKSYQSGGCCGLAPRMFRHPVLSAKTMN